jgi:uncharacterized membrane protein YkoI
LSIYKYFVALLYLMKNKSKLFVCMLAVITVFATSVIVSSSTSNTHIAAAQSNSTTTRMTGDMSNMTKKEQQNITGSIPIQSTMSQIIRSKIQVPLDQAVSTAQNSVGVNSSVVAAFLRPLNGFLVYNIAVLDTNNTIHRVIVDPGNGNVLYTSEGREMGSFNQQLSGPFEHGGFCDRGGFGHWKGHSGFGSGGFWHQR